MDSTDEELYGSTSFTTKGRRTKRRRIATSMSHGGDCVGYSITYGSSSNNSATPSTVDDHEIMSEVMTTTEEEEEDLANCLILLAQGAVQNRPSNINININIGGSLLGPSTSSCYKRPSLRKLIVIDNNDMYECKTCNKTFPSFQALGGHRTSHKKVVKPTPKPEGASRKVRNFDTMKMHACWICGAEFRSGQALGGHMRRHRSSAIAPPDSSGSGTRNILSLDLNLPAPHDDEDDNMVETMFHVILPTPPAPALVNCHY